MIDIMLGARTMNNDLFMHIEIRAKRNAGLGEEVIALYCNFGEEVIGMC